MATTESLSLSFDLPATPEAVFAAWTEAERVTVWWGESGVYRTTAWTADIRPGGAWRAEFTDVAGDVSCAEGRYVVVERPDRLVWTWRTSWEPEVETTLDMTFAAAAGGTTLTLAQSGFTSTSDRDDNADAWPQMIGWLSDYLAGQPR